MSIQAIMPTIDFYLFSIRDQKRIGPFEVSQKIISAFYFVRSDKHQMKDPHLDRIKNATLLIFGFTFPGLGLRQRCE